MVMYTVNYAAGKYSLVDTPTVTKVLTQVPPGGQTDYFFTSTNIYNATMFALQQPSGDWLGTLFYGRAVIGADGQVGFLPDAQIEGSVQGMSVDAFATSYVAENGSSDGLRQALFAGDDTLINNAFGGSLNGEAGNDVILGGGSSDGGSGDDVILGGSFLSGGSGDDILRTFADDADSASIYGGTGNDFIFMNGPNEVLAFGSNGIDTFFFDGFPPKYRLSSVADFKSTDRLQLDPNAYASLANGFSSDNFALDSQARDKDDFLILYTVRRRPAVLFYDPDGSGGEAQVAIASFSPKARVTWESILVSDETPATGGFATPGPSSHHESHPWAIHATGLLP
jgi:hypothetical protein